MRVRLAPFLLTLALLVVSVACRRDSAREQPRDGQVRVVTTLFPLYDWARQIGGERVHAGMLVPPGVEPHTFEPKPGDLLTIARADVFIYTGDAMEPWVGGILKGIDNPDLIVVDASKGIDFRHLRDGHGAEEDDHDGDEAGHHDHHHHEGSADPHIWLEFGRAATMVQAIADGLAQAAPAHAEPFRANAKAYQARLAAMDQRFADMLTKCRLHTIVYGGHFAFGYFADRYGLDHISPYKNFSPDTEPTPREIMQMVTRMKELGVEYIFHEELLDPKVARVLAAETGARLLVLNGTHNVSKDDLARGVTYLDLMERNYDNLKRGLDYQP